MKRLIVKFCLIFNLWCLKEKLHLHDFLSYLHHQKSDQNDALFLYILPIKGIYLLKGQEGQLTYSISTLLDNLKLYPKIQFSKKISIVNLNFEVISNDIGKFLNATSTWIIWIFAPKSWFCVSTESTITENCWILTIVGVKSQNLKKINAS